MNRQEVIGNIMREHRLAKGYTLQNVADRLDTVKVHISHWERGERRVSLVRFMDWCAALGASPTDVMREIERRCDDQTGNIR